MKLSGHSYNNDVFSSLLDGLNDDVILKRSGCNKTANAPDDMFSSVTQETFDQIKDEKLQTIAAELKFAADKAKVEINKSDLAKFAEIVSKDNLRGKELEKAARKYCSSAYRDIAPPQESTRYNADNVYNKVVSATYDPKSMSDGKTGGFLGMSKNPNSIWDSEAMTRLAQVKTGDEQIKESKEAREQSKLDQKQAFWEGLQEKHSDPVQVHKGITNCGTSDQTESSNQNLAANAMSIFSDDRDFANIPEKTDGETLKQHASDRSTKSAEAKGEWNKVASATKADNTLGSLFSQSDKPDRTDTDKMFEGLKLEE